MRLEDGAKPNDPRQGSPPSEPEHRPHPAPALDPSRPTWLRVLALAWPVLVQQSLIMAVGLYDQYLAGNNEPADPALHVPYQAAQTNANYLVWFIASFASFVGVGSTALVARFVGAGGRASAVHVTNQSILLAACFGLAGAIIGFVSVDWAIGLLHLSGPAADMAVGFLRPVLVLLPFLMIEAAGLACLVGAGDTRMNLWVLGGVAILNMPLAWLFFHGPEPVRLWLVGRFGADSAVGGWLNGLGPTHGFGFVGITMGTALSHTIGCLAVLVVLARGRFGLRLELRQLWPDAPLIRRLLRVSVPASIDVLSIGLCQLWFMSLVNGLGNVAATAHGIAIRCESLGYLSGQAFATAAAALVGQNLGAHRPHDAARSGWTAFGIGCAVMAAMGLLFFALAPAMFRLFAPFENQRPVIEAGVPVLRLVAFAMPALASTIVFTGALRGAGDTRWPVLFTWIGFLGVRIPLAYLLINESLSLGELGTLPGAGLGLFGAWLAMFADLMVRGLFFLWRFASGRWKATRV